MYRAGTAALVGRPNVGKSTLLNALIGQKLSIVTSRPQTTRESILAVKNLPEAQIVFLDTPGLHRRQGPAGPQVGGPLHQLMHDRAASAIRDADVVLFLTEATPRPKPSRERDDLVTASLADARAPVLLVLTKIDHLKDKSALLPQIDHLRTLREFAAVIPTSAVKGTGLPELTSEIVTHLPESPPLYPDEALTDRPERFFVAELIREQLTLQTHAELPYAIAVEIDSFEEGEKLDRIHATIHVEKASQKAIVIGRKGERLKAVGTAARKQIEVLLDRRVHLELFVRVTPGWTKDPRMVQKLVGTT